MRAKSRSDRWVAALVGLATASCYSGVGGGGQASGADASTGAGTEASATATATAGDSTGADSGEVPGDATVIPPSGLRRLTIDEYDSVLRDLLLDDSRSSDLLLPKDARTPFDNDASEQIPSQALIEGANLLAADAAARLLADPVKRDQVVGCTPAAPDDATCFGDFISQFGRRALRRPLTADELDDYLALLDYATETSDFYVAVDTAIRTFLQEPEFLYRVEVGEPVDGEPGVFRLSDFEMGTRLSFFLLGTTPPDWLLDSAEAAQLGDVDGVRAAATDLLDDERALARLDRFHALWLGYENLPHPVDLTEAMRAESSALVDRVVFDEDLAYSTLFTSTETWISDLLAEHYGLPLPGSDTPSWVDYGDSGRAGLLSHGSFLSVSAKNSDTSPTQRGILIRTRLFCQAIPPPPGNVDTDNGIPADADNFCKADRYAAHAQGGCAGCHAQMDPIGFGLENYDQMGRFREYELDNPDTEPDESTCQIGGEGEIVGVGTFSGPAELGQLMLDSGLVEHCVTTQLYRFAMGRTQLDEYDTAFIDALVANAGATGFHMRDMMLEFVTNDGFRFRREVQ